MGLRNTLNNNAGVSILRVATLTLQRGESTAILACRKIGRQCFALKSSKKNRGLTMQEGREYAAPPKAPRPLVDPEAQGEVDPSLYPEPKEATHKIRGKSDILEHVFGPVDPELLVVKSFYFFFYSAFGSLFPLMGVYFKQMGMNATQSGFLIGSRPFVEFLAAPFWGSLADRWQKGKVLLLASIACWIIFTVPLGSIQPPAISCMTSLNNSPVLTVPEVSQHLVNKRSVPDTVLHESYKRRVRSTRALYNISAGQSPVTVGYASNYKEAEHGAWVKPIISTIVYKTTDIQKAFFLLMLLIIIGEFFAAPAITLADSAVITILGEDADTYSNQRMFGSFGWGLAMFFVGIALDHSTSFPNHPCGPDTKERNYTICFATFSVLMGAALITATQINFKYEAAGREPGNRAPSVDHELVLSKEDQMQAQLAEQLNLPSLADTRAEVTSAPKEQKSKIFAQTIREMPEWVTVLGHFKNLKCLSFLFVAWFMGFGIGLIFTFLFWHLQDYDGTPTLFGVASVINHISEIFAYFFSFRLIRQLGHVKVLCLGLVANILRFLYISWLTNPWWVLPFEFMQGITHAAVWAACCSYISHNTPPELRSSAQGVLQGIHHGLGRGCGAVIGGMFVASFGSTSTFRGYGLICILVLAAFVFINFYRVDQGFVSDLPQTEDPRQVAEETLHLAPHGVPSNPIPRALSSNKLHELAQDGYGATYQTGQGGTLDIPGGAGYNPFQGTGSAQQRIARNQVANAGNAAARCNYPTASTQLAAQQPLTTASRAYDW
ncbi:major facilitator superfamily domain-containing protein 6 isoform X2 [Dendroctonus ponderosae]|uniref:major facilitator superfamily domain-containing protein 6 isoform X2 n=1 Tax=Dendroctonus ponderosae TaxID=77166 RepID=UPI00203501A7|nr:major facilitator superfamily domain-containing protein 6 isoform X2 [Dendroctonus ponderosae]